MTGSENPISNLGAIFWIIGDINQNDRVYLLALAQSLLTVLQQQLYYKLNYFMSAIFCNMYYWVCLFASVMICVWMCVSVYEWEDVSVSGFPHSGVIIAALSPRCPHYLTSNENTSSNWNSSVRSQQIQQQEHLFI